MGISTGQTLRMVKQYASDCLLHAQGRDSNLPPAAGSRKCSAIIQRPPLKAWTNLLLFKNPNADLRESKLRRQPREDGLLWAGSPQEYDLDLWLDLGEKARRSRQELWMSWLGGRGMSPACPSL